MDAPVRNLGGRGGGGGGGAGPGCTQQAYLSFLPRTTFAQAKWDPTIQAGRRRRLPAYR